MPRTRERKRQADRDDAVVVEFRANPRTHAAELGFGKIRDDRWNGKLQVRRRLTTQGKRGGRARLAPERVDLHEIDRIGDVEEVVGAHRAGGDVEHRRAFRVCAARSWRGAPRQSEVKTRNGPPNVTLWNRAFAVRRRGLRKCGDGFGFVFRPGVSRDRPGDQRRSQPRGRRKQSRSAAVLRGRCGRRRLQDDRRRRVLGADLRRAAGRADRRDCRRASRRRRRLGRNRRVESAEHHRVGRWNLPHDRRRTPLGRAGLERSAHISRICIDPRDRRVVAVGVLGRVSSDDPQSRRLRNARRRRALDAHALRRTVERRLVARARSRSSVDALRRRLAGTAPPLAARQRRPARRHLPIRRQRRDVAKARRPRFAKRSDGTHRLSRRDARPHLRDRRVARRRAVALRRRRRDVAEDAAQPALGRARVLFQQHLRRPGESATGSSTCR